MSLYKKFLEDTINILSFHQSIGVEKICLSKEVRDFVTSPLKKRPTVPTYKAAAKHTIHPKTLSPVLKEPRPSAKATITLSEIRSEIGDCTRCSLHQGRTSLLFGSGDERAKLLIVGEWPNTLDDQTGEIFSSEAGQMLDKMLTHVLNLSRDEVYLTSILKCCVASGRQGDIQQIKSCTPFIFSQIAAIHPEVICAMGPLAAQTLIKTNKPLVKLRGHFHMVNDIPLMPTFHPSYLIKNPEMKKAAMHDLQMIRQKLNS